MDLVEYLRAEKEAGRIVVEPEGILDDPDAAEKIRRAEGLTYKTPDEIPIHDRRQLEIYGKIEDHVVIYDERDRKETVLYTFQADDDGIHRLRAWEVVRIYYIASPRVLDQDEDGKHIRHVCVPVQ